MNNLLIGLLIYFLLPVAALGRSVTFHEEIISCIDRHILWQQFELAMTDSSDTWLWPQRSSQVVGQGMNSDAIIQVTYPLGPFKNTYDYRLKAIRSNSQFTYLAIPERHPFVGGATIDLKTSGAKTVLTWSGVYEIAAGQWPMRLVFNRFNRAFFAQLRQNISRAEQRFGCP